MTFSTNPQVGLGSLVSGGVTFLARRTYHVGELALNRELKQNSRENSGKLCIFAVPARG